MKKLLCLLVVFVFAFVLVACGGKSNEQIVGEGLKSYFESHSEFAGSTVISNIMSDDSGAAVLEIQKADGSTCNLMVSIKRTMFTSGTYSYDYIPGEVRSRDDSDGDTFMDYIFANARKKLTLDNEKINSYLK